MLNTRLVVQLIISHRTHDERRFITTLLRFHHALSPGRRYRLREYDVIIPCTTTYRIVSVRQLTTNRFTEVSWIDAELHDNEVAIRFHCSELNSQSDDPRICYCKKIRNKSKLMENYTVPNDRFALNKFVVQISGG